VKRLDQASGVRSSAAVMSCGVAPSAARASPLDICMRLRTVISPRASWLHSLMNAPTGSSGQAMSR